MSNEKYYPLSLLSLLYKSFITTHITEIGSDRFTNQIMTIIVINN
jgi:hypothetical protein